MGIGAATVSAPIFGIRQPSLLLPPSFLGNKWLSKRLNTCGAKPKRHKRLNARREWRVATPWGWQLKWLASAIFFKRNAASGVFVLASLLHSPARKPRATCNSSTVLYAENWCGYRDSQPPHRFLLACEAILQLNCLEVARIHEASVLCLEKTGF